MGGLGEVWEGRVHQHQAMMMEQQTMLMAAIPKPTQPPNTKQQSIEKGG